MRQLLFVLILLYSTGFLYADNERITANDNRISVIETDTNSTLSNENETAAADSIAMITDTVCCCTLEVITKPSDVSVVLDDSAYGISPITISCIDTGKHVISLKKRGFYQKKVVLTLTQPQKMSLNFSLSSPGGLTLTTVPDSVDVILNGQEKGITPYRDSLMKPGTYHLRFEKPTYVSVEDSIEVPDGEHIERLDTLVHSQAYLDSITYAREVAVIKAKRFTFGMIAGAFGMFLMIIMIIEGQSRE